jgi:hypothetical protein
MKRVTSARGKLPDLRPLHGGSFAECGPAAVILAALVALCIAGPLLGGNPVHRPRGSTLK